MSVERDIGELSARMGGVETDVSQLAADVKAIRSTIDMAKGGWRSVAIVAGVAGTCGAAAAKLATWLAFVPR